MTTAYVAFGGNIGKPSETYELAGQKLGAVTGIQNVRKSDLIETNPLGGATGQPAFRNGCFEVETSLTANQLLSATSGIEIELGRKRGDPWGPRHIDLDIVLFGSEIICSRALMIPHPRMHYRKFVIEPLAQLNPHAVHPILEMTIGELYTRMIATDRVFLVVDLLLFESDPWTMQDLLKSVGDKIPTFVLERNSVDALKFQGKELISARIPVDSRFRHSINCTDANADDKNIWIFLAGHYNGRRERPDETWQTFPVIDCRNPPTGKPEEYLQSVLASLS